MKEVIIYAPSLNATELLRSMAKNGVNTICYRVFNTIDLAKYILSKNGIALDKKIISSTDEMNIIASIYKDIPYFENCSYLDCSNISQTLFSLRLEVGVNEEADIINGLSKSVFKDKNDALVTLYKTYIKKLNELNVLDRIAVIRKALEYKVDCDVYILEEELYNVKEVCLYSCLKNINKTNLISLYNKEEKLNLNIKNYFQCYGVSNEIENIINYIYTSNIPLDKCLICYTNSDYIKNIYDYSLELNIPITLGEGIKVSDTNPGKLLHALYLHQLRGVGNAAKDSLIDLINSSFFNKSKLHNDLFNNDEEDLFNPLIELFGKLRLGFNEIEDEKKLEEVKPYCSASLYSKLIALYNIFKKGIFELAVSYSVDRAQLLNFDNSAKQKIKNFINSFVLYSGKKEESSLDEIINSILSQMCSPMQVQEGSIYACNINHAMSVTRPYLFIVGLDSSYPGGPKENYLVLDDELKDINPNTFNDSFTKLNNKKNMFYNVLNLNSILGNEISLSYSDYNLIDIKEVNKSSLLFEVYRKINGDKVTLDEFKKAFKVVSYFNNRLSINDEIGKAFVENKKILYKTKDDEFVSPTNLLDKIFTPTQIEKFFVCPYKFYLNFILGIDEPIKDDPFQAISAIDLGNIAHELMETFEKSKETKEQFLSRCEYKIKEFLSIRPPMYEYQIEKTINEFLDMMSNAYEMDYGNAIEAVEIFTDTLTIGGVKMSGKFDRLEKDKDGKYYLVDYKTKNNVEHEENDVKSCLQLAIYTKLLENGTKTKYKIENSEYRYFKLEQAISFKFNEENEQIFNEMINSLYVALKNHEFNKCENNEGCRYCSMKLACNLLEEAESND